MRLRYTFKDIAKRYIRMYGGCLAEDPSYGDMPTKMYLLNNNDEEIAIVNPSDFYYKRYDAVASVQAHDASLDDIDYDDIPY